MNDTILTGLISAAGSSSVIGLILKLVLSKLSADWAAMQESIKGVGAELQTIKIKMAVHEVIAEENKLHRDDMVGMKRDMIILQQQVQAAWRIIDQR